MGLVFTWWFCGAFVSFPNSFGNLQQLEKIKPRSQNMRPLWSRCLKVRRWRIQLARSGSWLNSSVRVQRSCSTKVRPRTLSGELQMKANVWLYSLWLTWKNRGDLCGSGWPLQSFCSQRIWKKTLEAFIQNLLISFGLNSFVKCDLFVGYTKFHQSKAVTNQA